MHAYLLKRDTVGDRFERKIALGIGDEVIGLLYYVPHCPRVPHV